MKIKLIIKKMIVHENLIVVDQSIHKNGKQHPNKLGTTHTIERTCDVVNEVQNDNVVTITTTTCLGHYVGPPNNDPIIAIGIITQQMGYNIYGLLQPIKDAP
jgi:hypothetical protein